MKLPAFITYLVAFVVIVAAAVFAVIARGAQDPRPRSPGFPVYWNYGSIQLKLGPFGEPVEMQMGMEFLRAELKPSGELGTEPVANLKVDLMGSGSVLVGDILYEDREIAAALEAIAMREFRLRNPQALPERRRALRKTSR